MRFLRTIIVGLLVALVSLNLSAMVFAAEVPPDTTLDPHKTILPESDKTVTECQVVMNAVNNDMDGAKKAISKREDFMVGMDPTAPGSEIVGYTTILACAIMTGDVKMWMVPYFIRYVLEFIIGIAGLIAVGAIVYGGYLYLFAGISDDKDKGKNAIKNGVIGLVLTLVAWAVVNIVIALVTG